MALSIIPCLKDDSRKINSVSLRLKILTTKVQTTFNPCISPTHTSVLGKSFKANLTPYPVTFVTVLTVSVISQLPTRPASLNDVLSPTSMNSSMYSTNSLFSVSSSVSSISSVGSPKMNSTEASIGLSTKLPSPKVAQTSAQYCDPLKKSPRPAKFGHPVVQDDIFSAQASNITMRRRDCPQLPGQIVPTRPNSPLSSRRFEDEIPGLYSFAGSAFGTNLKPIIIAHDKETQALLDQHQISWGTQYELARGVSLRTWTWEEVKDRVKDLTGDNAHAACQVPIIMRGKPAASTNPSDFYLWYVLSYHRV